MRLAVVAFALTLMACKPPKPPPAPEPPPKPIDEERTWSADAGAPGVVVQQSATDPRHCTCEGSRAGQVLWSVRDCLATTHQKRLVSPDGLGLLVLDENVAPDVDVLTTQVGRLYRRGALLRTLTAGDLSPGSTRLERRGALLHWLASAPTVTAGGTTLLLTDLHSAFVAWDAPGEGKLAAIDCSRGCKFTDEAGLLHVVFDANDVPPKLLGEVKALEGGTVSVLPGHGVPVPAPPANPD
jgi:hypothetical protein